ncbi:hypothetical protein BU24DRAFT_468223 [Aaosphaeria arxii CBS 175.79]|uniref:Transcription regulator Rua1 C-terminal domain-containing protein n=1 Tax=Aaosphaeria arxii CBS 175.79 TaxID=1450172 RepID=A0A6A5X877_9PLEO|nr:uncharacterized protein BU24DRAFT_468223 [Aaosphaeria arxii CBS 175.79]KAF2009245.1 hypothetical protein BU24DRAFT_468223 [Aaosphaeria arxii CBS 175.79]
MEFNAVQQYRPTSSTNRQFPHAQPTLQQPPNMMYPYGNMQMQHHLQRQSQQQQQQQHAPQQQSKPSPPYPTWAVPQTHSPYNQMQRSAMPASRDDHEQRQPKINVTSSHSPAMSNATFRNAISGPETLQAPDYFPGVIDTSPWGQKVCEELEAFPSMDPDMAEFNQGLMGHDENTPIIDLRQYHGMEQQEADQLTNFNPTSSRRLSESSFSMSSTGGVLPEVTTYEELGSSEAVSYASDCEAWNNLEPAPSLLSPLASPRRPQHDNVVRSGSRSRVSPAPHNNVRSSPYTLESTRFKRWSTGHAPTSTPVSSRALAQVQDRFTPYGSRLNPHHSMPAYPSSAMHSFGLQTQNVLYSQPHPLQSSNPTLFSSHDQPYQLEVPRPLPSQGLFRLLQSNADRHGGCASHFADLSDPPDLYSSLHEEPSNPPESDMNPSDPDMVPHEQDLRFTGDLYTPRWVRGHGNKREGWCGLCKPGRWLVLKNSAFWYDKSFTHGVSAATGAAFQGPQRTRRTEGNLDVWEGLCGSCNEWIALVSSKKKGTTWFRHAYKCHTHPKVKDGPKRRRETHTVRARAASSASATSSSYPINRDAPQESAAVSVPARHNLHSTPTPSASAATACSTPQQQYVGMPTSLSLSHSQPSASYPISTPTSMQPPTTYSEMQPKQEPIVGLFGSPLQSMGNFGTSGGPNPAIQVSEPELVGIRMNPPLNSLASMI